MVVVAPFAGYISQRRVAMGEFVQPSTAVVTLLRIDPLRLQLTIPSVQAAQVAVGQAVTARVDAFPGKIFEGKISAINPLIAAESRSFIVEAKVPNPKGSSSRECLRSRPSIRADRTGDARAEARGDRGRQHQLVPRLRRRQGKQGPRAGGAARRPAEPA